VTGPLERLTARQRIAIANPCANARDALGSEFYRALWIGSMSLSTILTVNK